LALHTEPIIEQGESTSDGLAIEQLHAYQHSRFSALSPPSG
jgi:hypothetical protein